MHYETLDPYVNLQQGHIHIGYYRGRVGVKLKSIIQHRQIQSNILTIYPRHCLSPTQHLKIWGLISK